jgi:hypothetical protein
LKADPHSDLWNIQKILTKFQIMSAISFEDGLFGKKNMYLFGGGNAWKFKFATEDKFPSQLS